MNKGNIHRFVELDMPSLINETINFTQSEYQEKFMEIWIALALVFVMSGYLAYSIVYPEKF